MGKKVKVWVSDFPLLGNEEAPAFDKNGKLKPLESQPIEDPGHYEWVDEDDLKNNGTEGRDTYYWLPDIGFVNYWGMHGVSEDVITKNSGEKFHIGQHYDKEPASVQQCSICGSTDFNVAIGGYYTAIRCVKCRWEWCIHSG